MYLRTSERFWSKVANRDDPESCWVWTDRNIKGGYGHFRATVDGVNRHYSAHRWSFEEANGPIPPGMLICHRCDNPPCVNPAHLFMGTQQDNVNDMMRKARARPRRGEEHFTSKLTPDDVEEIRRLVNVDRASVTVVAERFGVHHKTVRRTATGQSWSHVALSHQPWVGRSPSNRVFKALVTVDERGWIRCGRCKTFQPPSEYAPSMVKRRHGYCRPCFRAYYQPAHQRARESA